jgi:predicted nucleotidyltransferase component of viral defense system
MFRPWPYSDQVQLLVRVLPLIATETCFALKGGTAINLFIRDLPRLSVDIDLVYLPLEDRETTFTHVRQALKRIAQGIPQAVRGATVENLAERSDSLRLLIRRQSIQIKVELSPVLRGSIYPPELLAVRPSVEDQFGFAEIQVMSFADLYAGKVCAALDRQHPRDLFDIKLLLENEGMTRTLRKAILAYLVSHNRPIEELLEPTHKDICDVFEGEFRSMTQQPVSVEALVAARENLVATLNQTITLEERRFLLSFNAREPQWDLLGLEGVQNLPAVRWKLLNLQKMDRPKWERSMQKLRRVLQLAEELG